MTVLDVPLIVVLGHDSCGAVKATLSALEDGEVPGGYVRDIVERVTPSILLGRTRGADARRRVRGPPRQRDGRAAVGRSRRSSSGSSRGSLAIAGVTYHLADGRVVLREHVGDIGVA